MKPQEVIEDIKGPLGRGELILFSGVGLSLGARDRDGNPVPSSWDLRNEVHSLPYPGEDPAGDDSSLAELYAVAHDRERGALADLLSDALQLILRASQRNILSGFACRGLGLTR